MPHSKNAKKRLRQSIVRRERNRAAKSALKTAVRKVRDEAAAGQVANSEADFRVAAKKLDQAAAKGVIHVRKAARLKSRMSARIKAAKGKS